MHNVTKATAVQAESWTVLFSSTIIFPRSLSSSRTSIALFSHPTARSASRRIYYIPVSLYIHCGFPIVHGFERSVVPAHPVAAYAPRPSELHPGPLNLYSLVHTVCLTPPAFPATRKTKLEEITAKAALCESDARGRSEALAKFHTWTALYLSCSGATSSTNSRNCMCWHPSHLRA
jgi:hypothetical protein